jgi:hypothetical protein
MKTTKMSTSVLSVLSALSSLFAMYAMLMATSAAAQSPPPDARHGFQMSIRLGYERPVGLFDSGEAMSSTFGAHYPIILDIGARVGRGWFIGGYLGLAAGEAAGDAADYCGSSCTSFQTRFGLSLAYSFAPASRWNPWIGYSLGFETINLSMGDGNSVSAYGFELGIVSVGVDYRASRGFGIGPWVGAGAGMYSSVSVTGMGDSGLDRAVHGWIMGGLRFVVFP